MKLLLCRRWTACWVPKTEALMGSLFWCSHEDPETATRAGGSQAAQGAELLSFLHQIKPLSKDHFIPQGVQLVEGRQLSTNFFILGSREFTQLNFFFSTSGNVSTRHLFFETAISKWVAFYFDIVQSQKGKVLSLWQ